MVSIDKNHLQTIVLILFLVFIAGFFASYIGSFLRQSTEPFTQIKMGDIYINPETQPVQENCYILRKSLDELMNDPKYVKRCICDYIESRNNEVMNVNDPEYIKRKDLYKKLCETPRGLSDKCFMRTTKQDFSQNCLVAPPPSKKQMVAPKPPVPLPESCYCETNDGYSYLQSPESTLVMDQDMEKPNDLGNLIDPFVFLWNQMRH